MVVALWLVAWRLVCVDCGVLFVVCYIVFVCGCMCGFQSACCVVRWLLYVLSCEVFRVCCLLRNVCCVRFVVRCVRFVVRCLVCVV